MKHFQTIEVAPPAVTYDTMHSVTLSLSDWNDAQMYLRFYADNMVDRGERYEPTAKKVRAILSRMYEQTDTALTAAAEECEQ